MLHAKTGMRCPWKKHCNIWQIIYQTKSVEGFRMIRNIHGKNHCMILHGCEYAVELRDGHVNH